MSELCTNCGHDGVAHAGRNCFGIPSHTHPCRCNKYDPNEDAPEQRTVVAHQPAWSPTIHKGSADDCALCTAFTPAQPATKDECQTDHVNGPVRYVICAQCGEVEPLCRDCDYDIHGHWPCDEEQAPAAPASEVPDLQAALEHESGACSDLCLYCHGYLPTLAAGIEGVLGEHLYNGGGTCTCDGMAGEDINGRVEHQAAIDRHRAHVASQVIAYLHRTGAEE